MEPGRLPHVGLADLNDIEFCVGHDIETFAGLRNLSFRQLPDDHTVGSWWFVIGI